MALMRSSVSLAVFFFIGGCATTAQSYPEFGTKLYAQKDCSSPGVKKWALVVGIDRYKNIETGLKNAISDAWRAREMFIHHLQIDESRIVSLFGANAEAAIINDRLADIAHRSCAGDQIFLYFAGHGAVDSQDPDQSQLLAYDDEPGKTGRSFLGSADLVAQLAKLEGSAKDPADRRQWIIFADACYSSLGAPRDQTVTSTESGPQWRRLSASSRTVNDDYLCGDVSGTVKYRGGIFTCHLLLGLLGRADADKNKEVSWSELETYVREQVHAPAGEPAKPQSAANAGELVLSTTQIGIRLAAVPKILIAPPQLESGWKTQLAFGGGALGLIGLAVGGIWAYKASEIAADLEDYQETGGMYAELREEYQRNLTITQVSSVIGFIALAGGAVYFIDHFFFAPMYEEASGPVFLELED